MFGKWTVRSYTYQQFTRSVKRHLPDATEAEIYHQWNRTLEEEPYDPAASARRIVKLRERRAKYRTAHPQSTNSAASASASSNTASQSQG